MYMPLFIPNDAKRFQHLSSVAKDMTATDFCRELNDLDISSPLRWGQKISKNEKRATPLYIATIILFIKRLIDISEEHPKDVRESLDILLKKLIDIEYDNIIEKYTSDGEEIISALKESKEGDKKKSSVKGKLFGKIRDLWPHILNEEYNKQYKTDSDGKIDVSNAGINKCLKIVEECVHKLYGKEQQSKKRKRRAQASSAQDTSPAKRPRHERGGTVVSQALFFSEPPARQRRKRDGTVVSQEEAMMKPESSSSWEKKR